MNQIPDFIPRLECITTPDESFMVEALREARRAFMCNEVPVGAVIVFEGEIIARGYNQVELLRDATAHAEMLCITAAEEALGNWRLSGCTLYTTLEPCSMCAGAALLSRVDRIVWGAPDIRHGANGSFINIFEKKHPTHNPIIEGGVLKEWCERAMKLFFQKRRNEKEL